MTQKHLLMRSWSDDYDTETFVNEVMMSTNDVPDVLKKIPI